MIRTAACGCQLSGRNYTQHRIPMQKNVRFSRALGIVSEYPSILITSIHACTAHQLNWYRFIGRVLGKALYEGILIEVGFASFFLGKVSAFRLLRAPALEQQCSMIPFNHFRRKVARKAELSG